MAATDAPSNRIQEVASPGQEPGEARTRLELPGPEERPSSPDTHHPDRAIGWILFAFFLALYLLTGGGHRYSPDGEFAYRVARSLTLDPQHEYLRRMQGGLSQWGFMVPLLAQPLVLLGEPLSKVMPQKDYVIVDGRTYVIGKYRDKQQVGDDAPTVGPNGTGAVDTYIRTNLKVGPATSLGVISFLALAKDIPQGTTVAELTVTDSAGASITFPLRAGVETAEWSLAKSGEGAGHQMARVASIWAGNTGGRNYFAELPFGRVFQPQELKLHYLLPSGHLYIRSLALLNQNTGGFEPIPGEDRTWSEWENADLFTSFFYSPYNAIITALGCVLLFALARSMGYGQRVSMAITLIYGAATLAWPYSKYDFSEPTLVLFVLLTLYLILRWDRDRRDYLLLLAGLASLASVGTKYASGVLVPLMLLQILLLHWEKHPSFRELPGLIKPLLLFCAPFLVLAAPAVWYLSSRFGYYPSILEAWAGVQRGWLPLPFAIGMRGLLFSPGKSFFLYSPPTVLALASVVPFARRHGIRSVAILTVILVYFTIYSKKAAWHAGAGWGPRYQVLVIPLVILLMAPLIKKAIEERHRWYRYVLLAVFVFGVGLQMLAVSKSFDDYLGIFRYQVVGQLPDQGAQYGGGDYYPYSAGLDDGNSITATLWAWPFSPILAQAWMLGCTFLTIGPSSLETTRDTLLSTPPWKLWGIDVQLPHPEYGIGFDFWSMKMWTDFPSYPIFRAGVFIALLLIEVVLVTSGSRLVSALFAGSPRRTRALRTWLLTSITLLLLFDGIHFIL